MRLLIVANTDWYLFNFRSSLIRAALAQGHSVAIACPDGPYRAALSALGATWHGWTSRRRSLNVVHDLRSAAALARVIDAVGPDLVHNFTLKSILAGTLAAAPRPRLAVVNSYEGLGYVFSSAEWRARAARPVLAAALGLINRRRNSRTIVLNRADFALFVRARLAPAARMIVIPGAGVDTQALQPRAAAPERFTVLYASRLLASKGVATLVDAVDGLVAQGHDIRLRIAGDIDAGSPDSIDPAQLERWRQRPHIEILGHRADVAALIAASSVVVLVSSYGEGVPTILVEAGALAVPVVTSPQPGCLEVVGDEVVGEEAGGLVVAPGDAAVLGKALLRLKHDPLLAARLGSAGRRRIVDRFEQSTINERILATYAELVPAGLRGDIDGGICP